MPANNETAWILPGQRAAFYDQLGRQLRAGLPLSASLRNVAKGPAPKAFGRALKEALGGVERGEALTVALRRHPNAFPAHDVGFLHAAEAVGALPAACQHLADDYRARQTRMIDLVVKSAYPVGLFTAAIVLLPIPLVFQGGLGLYLAAMLPGLLALGLVLAGVAWLAFMPAAAGARSRLLLAAQRVPWLGEQLRQLAIARTVRLLAACIGAGISPGECFRAAQRATSDPAVARACAAIAARLDRGHDSFASALAAQGQLFGGELQQIVAAGEESGTLDESLARAATEWEARGALVLNGLFALLRWTVMLGAFAYVGWRIVHDMTHALHQVAPLLD